MAITRESFLLAAKLKRQPVNIEGVGTIHVRELTAAEVVQFIKVQSQEAEGMAFLVTRCLCDESGNRILLDSDTDTVKGFGATTANAIVTAALEVSGLKVDTSKSQVGTR